MQVKDSLFLDVFILEFALNPRCVAAYKNVSQLCYVHFEVVNWKRGNERTERQTQKIETALLGGTAVKSSRKERGGSEGSP